MSSNVPVTTVLSRSVDRLQRAGIDSPRLSTEILLTYVLNVDRLWLLTHPEAVLTEEQSRCFRDLLDRRAAGEPVAYLVGKKEFYGLEFRVTPDVLIPRPETESILETIGGIWPKETHFRFIDVGTGSGALGIGLATMYPHSQGVLLDISQKALAVAWDNIRLHGLGSRLIPVQGDLLGAVRAGSIDVVVSNPPYVSSPEFWAMSAEVRNYEPARSLWGGLRGTELPVRLLKAAQTVLSPGGTVCMEIGHDQGAELLDLVQQNRPDAWKRIQIVHDLAGLDRVLWARRV